MFQIEISHPGLKRYRLIKGSSVAEVENKARAQLHAWNETFGRKLEAEERRYFRERDALLKGQQVQLALEWTREAECAIAEAQAILASALRDRRLFDWESLKERTSFDKPRPVPPVPPQFPEKRDP